MPRVILETSAGEIHLELDSQHAPISVTNFLQYVRSGHYDGTIFHRVISTFMIQGGGMTADMREKRGGSPIKNEAHNGLPNRRGTVAMARTSVVDSATAQFFINVKDNAFLNHQNTSSAGYGYAVFGTVVQGMDIVDRIKNAATTSKGGHSDVPVTPVVIRRAYEAPEAPPAA